MNVKIAAAIAVIIVILSLVITHSMVTAAAYAQEEQYSFAKKWGSQGVEVGKFLQPIDITVSSSCLKQEQFIKDQQGWA